MILAAVSSSRKITFWGIFVYYYINFGAKKKRRVDRGTKAWTHNVFGDCYISRAPHTWRISAMAVLHARVGKSCISTRNQTQSSLFVEFLASKLMRNGAP